MKAQTRIQPVAKVERVDPWPAPPSTPPPVVTVGRTVNYVLKDGQIRPLLVVRVWSPVYINGVLTFDGSNDANILPCEHPNPAAQPTMWLTSIHYDAEEKPGTWHWPERV